MLTTPTEGTKIMARVHRVESSRTPHQCKAGHVIEPPEGYTWAAPGFRSRKRFACARHPFRPSELTTSAVSSVLAAQEALSDAAESWETPDDVQAALDEFRDVVQEFYDEREQALDAWENGDGQLEELRDQAQEALDAVEGVYLTEWPGEVDGVEIDAEDAKDSEDDNVMSAWAEFMDEIREQVTSAADEATGAL